MKHGDFPLANLVVLLCRQLAQPLSMSIVNFSKRHKFFRRYGLILPGKIYHNIELHSKYYILRNDKKFYEKFVSRIDDTDAEKIGAQLLLEVSIKYFYFCIFYKI